MSEGGIPISTLADLLLTRLDEAREEAGQSGISDLPDFVFCSDDLFDMLEQLAGD